MLFRSLHSEEIFHASKPPRAFWTMLKTMGNNGSSLRLVYSIRHGFNAATSFREMCFIFSRRLDPRDAPLKPPIHVVTHNPIASTITGWERRAYKYLIRYRTPIWHDRKEAQL
jgi:hypothetical protein